METHLTFVDDAVLLAYLAGMLFIGFRVSRRITTGHDFFLAGRSLPWWAIGFSLVATDIGGTDLIGVGGSAYRYGLAVGNFDWIGCVPAMIIAAFIFIPIFWRAGVYTIPEFFERRFNAGVRSALAVCWLVFMACNLGIMLFASAKMMEVLLGWSPSVCVWGTALLVGAYTLAGGLAAVVYTDVAQCLVMIGGCLLVLILGIWDLGGIGPLIHQVQAAEMAQRAATQAAPHVIEHTRLILPVNTQTPFPWTGILFGLGFILGPAYWIGNQAIVQRSLGARTEFEAKASYIWGALLKNLIPVIIAVPGLIALAMFPHLTNGDDALPTLVAKMLPSGLRGLFLAAFLAALMSSVDSYLNSAATILTKDLYQRFLRPQADEVHLLKVGRSVTVGLMGWAVFFAFQVARMQSGIYSIFQTLMAFFQGPALAVLLTGLLWRRANGTGALAGFLGGVGCAVGLFVLNQPAVFRAQHWPPLFKIHDPFLYFSIWAFVVALVLIVGVSLLTRAEPEEKTSALMYRRTAPKPANALKLGAQES